MHAAYINGRFLAGEGPELVVHSPSDERVLDRFPAVSVAQVAQAIEAARRTYDAGPWRRMERRERAVLMHRFAEELAKHAERLIGLAISEGGCPVSSMVMFAQVRIPLKQAHDIVELYLSLPEIEENPVPLADRVTQHAAVQSLRYYTSLGVVAGIPANNAPFYTALWKVFPALMAGNTIVLRPNPLTPTSSMVIAEAAHAVGIPPGVLNVVLDAGVEGAVLLSTDPAVDMVAFTGSSAVGVEVMRQAAPTMKRLQLELGGKSAQIYLPDFADRAIAAPRQLCTSHAGQGCVLGSRIFIPEDRKAELIEKMVADVSGIKIGPADDPATQLGPMIAAASVARCERITKAAVDEGGRVATGGKRPARMNKGFYFEPTILDVPDNRNTAAQEEVFGPVVTVIGYRDVEHAIEMANDSRYGLSGYVYGGDKAESLRVARELRTGTVQVNGAILSAWLSTGGQRLSGVNRERGVEGIRVYQQLMCLNIG